jgi:hypothetical protein
VGYELSGKIKLIQDEKVFDSGFRKREIVVTVEDGKYPQDILLEFVQDKADLLSDCAVNQEIKVTFDIRGREYNGRYFNNLVGWRIEKQGAGADTRADEPAENYDSAPPTKYDDTFDDDIPF